MRKCKCKETNKIEKLIGHSAHIRFRLNKPTGYSAHIRFRHLLQVVYYYFAEIKKLTGHRLT